MRCESKVTVNRDDPPTLLIHGDKDELVNFNQSQYIYDAFRTNDVTCQLIVMEGAGQGFKGEDDARAAKALVNWFDHYLAKKKT